MASIHISLSDQMKDYVEAQVAGGQYHNVSEYVRDLIRNDKQEREQKLRREALEAAFIRGEKPEHVPQEIYDHAIQKVKKLVDEGDKGEAFDGDAVHDEVMALIDSYEKSDRETA